MRISRLASKRTAVIALAGMTLALVAVGNSSAQAAPDSSGATKLYLVQTAGDPVGTYTGGVAGIAATAPAEGERVDTTTSHAKAYSALLRGRHDAALRAAGVADVKKRSDYSIAFNGFAADLTDAQKSKLARTPGVLRIWENETVTVDTTTTPNFLGLTGPDGVWQKRFGGTDNAGAGIIIGVIDSGIWSESASFAPLPTPRWDQALINHKWHGTCDTGVESPISCNNKLIGARYFYSSAVVNDFEFLSPRDFGGHGTHTASTSGGNNGVAATINGGAVGSISGIAPAARIAAYKVLWEVANPDGSPAGTASGSTVDIVQAIDAAVADGVDVINYSISGGRDFIVSPDEIAFRNAAAAGVFVSTSAGNSGDTFGPSSVAHNAPWTTTVAASTHDRGNAKSVVLGNGVSYTGVGVVPGAVASTGLVNSADIPAAGHTAAEAQLCMPGSLNAAAASGKIIICTRGVNARVEKSAVVKAAGGVGMVMANTSNAQSLNGDFHAVPSVHLNATDGAAVKAYAASAGAGATASLSITDTTPVQAPGMAGFSSYGPATAGGGDLLKPDITAPGVDVIASVAPPGDAGGNNFNAFSGTSMSAPHIAGVAALIMSAHPLWPVSWVKSAIMTTAYQVDNTGVPIQWSEGDATPLNYGAGHVSPAKAFDPGLVYASGPADWDAYACAIGQLQLITDPSYCAALPVIDPSDLNYPSIAVGDLLSSQTVKRTVTNASLLPAVYKATVQAPPGFTVTVSPSILTLLPLQKKSFTVKITRTSAALGDWSFGSLTWIDQAKNKTLHSVRSPIAVRPVSLSAVGDVSATGSGTSVGVRVGYSGTLTASVAGLAPATLTSASLDPAGPAFDSDTPAASSRTLSYSVTVPAGGTGRVGTFGADYAMDTDTDVFVYQGGVLVDQSADADAEELVTLGAGTYTVYITLFAASGVTTIKGNSFVVDGAAGNFTATPASQSVTSGNTATVNLGWTGLTPGQRYLGVVTYGDGTATLGRTIVTVS